MKLYTEKALKDFLTNKQSFITLDDMYNLESIEIPSDEEIKTYLNNHSYEFEHGFKDAIEFMKNKIQGGNK